jgi:hemerythrin-like domain-containing protein
MLRDKNLIPLSRQHQHALALCVRIDRASPIGGTDLAAWESEIAELFRTEVAIHFAAEEQMLFPAARRFTELFPLVDELLADHAWLRDRFALAESRNLSADDLLDFAHRLSAHIRKEERQLFEHMQKWMSEEELALLGRQLDGVLKDAEQVCIVPTVATKLQPGR